MKGTPNRRTVEVCERLAALECDPIEGMARIALDSQASPELRGRMFAELASYVYPKRKATEIKVEEGPRVTFHLNTNVPNAKKSSGSWSISNFPRP